MLIPANAFKYVLRVVRHGGDIMQIRAATLLFAIALATEGCNTRPPDTTTAANNVTDQANQLAAQQAEAREREIERILGEDAHAGALGSASLTASAMRAINIDNAPQDFREAYLAHTQAWEDYARADEQLRYLNSQAASDEAWRRWWIATFRGSDDTPVTDLEAAKARMRDRRSAADETIRTSWQLVERIAVANGARVPRPANANSNNLSNGM